MFTVPICLNVKIHKKIFIICRGININVYINTIIDRKLIKSIRIRRELNALEC